MHGPNNLVTLTFTRCNRKTGKKQNWNGFQFFFSTVRKITNSFGCNKLKKKKNVEHNTVDIVGS